MNQHPHQHIQLSQQNAISHPQQIQVTSPQQINYQQQQIYTMSPPKNVRIETQGSPCRIVNYQQIGQIQQIHKIPQQQYYLGSQITPIRQRISSTIVSQNSLSQQPHQNQIPGNSQIQIQTQQTTQSSTNPLQTQQQNQQNTPQNLQSSSKPISQMPEKHRLLQQSSKNNTQNNQQLNQNQNSNNQLSGGGLVSNYLNNQQKQQPGYMPSSSGIRGSTQRIKHKSEMNLPSEYLQTPLQHIQTPQQMINMNNMVNKNNLGSPPVTNISISQNLLPNHNINDESIGTPLNQNNDRASFFNDNNASNSAGFPNMPTNSSNNQSIPQTAAKYPNQKNQNTQDRSSSPYNNLQNQLSTNQKSPNYLSSNLGFSTQNSSQIPYVFSEEAAVGSINAGNSTSANRYVSKVSISPQRVPQFFLKQNYQFSSGNGIQSNAQNANSGSFVNSSQIGIPQQTKSSTEAGRSNSCSDIRKRSQYRNVLQWDNSNNFNNNTNNRTLNISTNNNDRTLDRSVERSNNATGNDIVIPKPYSTNNQSNSFMNMPRTPTRINPSSSTTNLQMSLLNSNSKKLRELEEQVRELVNENTKMSQLLEEKGYLLQQLQDEKLVQKLLLENSELKEKLRKAMVENDLTIQNRVLHTENANLNKILSEKVKEIRELKDVIQANADSQRKQGELERNIKLLISENEHLGEVLKQRQNEIQKLREDNSVYQNKTISMQSHIKDIENKLLNHDQVLNQLRNMEQKFNSLEHNSTSNDKYFSLKNQFDNISRQLEDKESEIAQNRFQNEQNIQKISKEAEDQITKLVEENEKLNEIINQYVNSSNADILNSNALGKAVNRVTIGKDEEEKLMIFDSLQNCNKDYEDKINTLVAQNKNLEEVIHDLEKDKQELAENLQFMEERQKTIERQYEDLQLQAEQNHLQKQENQNQNGEELLHGIQQLELECQALNEQLDKVNRELGIKQEEQQQLTQQQEENKVYFEQIVQEKLEQINKLNQQLQDQSNYIEALQQQQTGQDGQGQEESRKKSQKQPNQRDQEDQLNNSSRISSQSNLQQEFENLSQKELSHEDNEEILDLSKYQKEIKEKNDIIKNLCENLDFQKEQVNELNDKVEQQAMIILQQQEQIKQSQNEINIQGEKIMELLSNLDQKSLNKSEKKSKDALSSTTEQQDLIQQVEYKDHLIQENILVIKQLEDKVIDLQKQLKEFKPDLQLDTSSVVNIERLESQTLMSPTLSPDSKQEKKVVQQDEKIIHLQQQQLQEEKQESIKEQQQNLVNPEKIQQIIDREIQSFDKKYKEKMEDLEKEMHSSLNEREEKIVQLVNENQKLLQLNEQRLIELQILNQQIEMRKEQNIRDTKTIEELQKKIQMMLSIQKNTSLFQQTSSERSLIDSIQEEESEESQDIDGQKQQQQQVIQSHETKRLARKLEEKRRQLSEVKQELENLKEKMLDFEEIEFRLTSDNRQLQEEVRRLQQQSEDNNKLNEMLKARKNEYNELKKRFEAIRTERDELVSKLKENKSQQEISPTNQSKSQVNSFELFKEIENIKKENVDLKKIHDQFVVQIKKKEKEIAEKQEELDQVKSKCNELSEKIQTSHSAPQSFCIYQGQEEQVQKPNSANNL